MIFQDFYNKLKTQGLSAFKKYYSNYEGEVVSNDDPENLGRLKIKVRSIYGNTELQKWALPKGVAFGKNIGMYLLPAKGDNVWIEFIEGDARFPIWNYGWMSRGEGMEDASNKVMVLQCFEHRIEFNGKNGTILIRSKDGMKIELNQKASIGGSGKYEKAVLGETLKLNVSKDNLLLKTLKNAIVSAPVVPLDGGATFKTTIVSAISALQSGDYSKILSDKLTIE